MRLQVRFELDVPDDMPLAAAKEWIAYEVGDQNSMQIRHPMMERDVEPALGTLVVWQL